MSTFLGKTALVAPNQTLVLTPDTLCRITILKSVSATPASVTITGSQLRNASALTVGGVVTASLVLATTGDAEAGMSWELQCSTVTLTGAGSSILVQYNT